VGGYAGVFVAGDYPCWVLSGTQGALRFHAMPLDNRVVAFAPFHNANCERGFMYLNDRCDMRICQLDPAVNYDASYPVYKAIRVFSCRDLGIANETERTLQVNLKCTPYFVVYLLDSRTYAIALSQKQVPDLLPALALVNVEIFGTDV